MSILQKILQGAFLTEEAFIPVFVKTPGAQTIAAVALVVESEVAALFGVQLPLPTAPTPAPTATPTA